MSDSPDLSSHVCTTSLFTVGVLITWAKLVALKSPVFALTVTSVKSIFALTDVKRTLHNLSRVRHRYTSLVTGDRNERTTDP